MAYSSLNYFVTQLERAGELVRINEFVDPVLEITEVTDRISKQKDGGKALLFENTGTKFPVLINAFGSLSRMAMSLGVENLDDISKEIEQLFKELLAPKANFWDKIKMLPKLSQISSWMPKVISGKGDCQDTIIENPNINDFPVLKCWSQDGGRFITLPMVITKDPNNGIRNVGMYRMQIFENKMTGMHWHKHKVGARHYEEYKKLGKKMPVAVALGGDPVYTYSATAPLPDMFDEFLFAGFLRKKKVNLVKCITQDLEVPADADIIIEGYVDTEEDFIWEGPFGDHTGFYSLADWYPKFHITCITHKENPIYPATIVGIPPMEDAYIAKATERIFLAPIKLTMLPEMQDMNMPVAGVAHNITIVKIEKSFPGHALKVMNALWGAGQMMFNKILIVADKSSDIHNYNELAKVITNNVEPERDVHFSYGPLDVLDHAADNLAYGGKMCIDATKKYPEELRNGKEVNGNVYNISIDEEEIKEKYPEIEEINSSYLKQGVSLVVISFLKNKKKHVKCLAEKLVEEDLKDIKFIVFVDDIVEINESEITAWVCAGNSDPARDCWTISSNNQDETSHLIIDGTRKTNKEDGFNRRWPNVIVADDKTIKSIDEKWGKLGLGKFIPSPSLRFKKWILNQGAEVKEEIELDEIKEVSS